MEKLYPLQTLQTLQTPLPTFPISATTLIIFGFLFINLFYKKIFSIFGKNFTLFKRFKRFKRLQTPQNTPNASSNFSNFRNYPNYFRFPIYKFILQKNIFYFYISRTTRRLPLPFNAALFLFCQSRFRQLFQFPQLP